VNGSTDARGVATSYAYDALNRQTLASYVGGSVALEYDNVATGGAYARGLLTRITDPSGNTSYAYDSRGRSCARRSRWELARREDVRCQLSVRCGA
jgi:YD repeat-containing protein